MNKPWDDLRESKKPPIRAGIWKETGTPRIELCNLWSSGVDIRFGNTVNDTIRFDIQGLRLLAEFCTELADQIEGK